MSTEEQKIRRRAIQARYDASPKGRARRARYNASPKGKKTTRSFGKVFLYGVTEEQINDRLTLQGGLCGICGEDITGPRKAHVDHNHKKKKGEPGFVRGLLCGRCNLGGGQFRDDPALLQRAAVWFS